MAATLDNTAEALCCKSLRRKGKSRDQCFRPVARRRRDGLEIGSEWKRIAAGGSLWSSVWSRRGSGARVEGDDRGERRVCIAVFCLGMLAAQTA